MSSRGKKKTTMAKLTREARLRERRSEKQARKVRRRDAAEAGESEWLQPDGDVPPADDHETASQPG
jgi:hypothetical protein